MHSASKIGFWIILVMATVIPAAAQWTNFTMALRPGWNSIYLEVQPEPRDCDTAFANLPVESVWMWNRRFSTVEFIQEPDSLTPNQPDWLNYVPPHHPGRATASLFTLLGGRS